jgi:hypothetical protein
MRVLDADDNPRIAMDTLSESARSILDRMKPDRSYEIADLRALMPHTGADTLREMMHELWVNRHVERVGHLGWRRHRSTGPHERPADVRLETGRVAPASPSRETKVVTPEELFDHDAFADFFR